MRINNNSRDVALAVEEYIKEIQLPPDVKIKVLDNRSFLVNAIITVARNLTEGGLLVITILFLIPGNIKTALLVAIAIPLSMLFAGSSTPASGGSLLIAMILMPLLAYYCISLTKSEKEPLFFQLLERIYKPFLGFSLHHPFKVIVQTLPVATFVILKKDKTKWGLYKGKRPSKLELF